MEAETEKKAVETEGTGSHTRWQRVQAFRERHSTTEMAAFFFVGFLYDVLTLSRIDDGQTLVQQGAYLGVLGTLLLMEQRWSGEAQPPRWLEKAWRFREDALHFFFGSLLSSYTLFYFKSASGLTSLLFLVALFGLLVANELPRFRAQGPVVRVALYSLCLTSYFAYLLPVALGFLSGWLFVLAVALGAAAVAGVYGLVRRWSGDGPATLRRVGAPGLGMQGALLGLYLLGVIPPVPLAVQSSGIYHEVRKVGREYHLLHERPAWKVWQRGDQDFRARPGDKVHYFVSIFAPAHFQDRVVFRWYYDDPQKGWTDRGTFTLRITGGREQGFRGWASKSNFEPGDWRVSVETEDGREMGRLDFAVRPDDRTEPRDFQVEQG